MRVVVVLATIAMVSSLLFFLYDVRSVFLPGAGQLKWLGFWFVWAVVLIARYGRFAGGGVVPPSVYGAVLGFATFFVMAASPWESPDAGLLGPLSNGIILLVVWRFATSLTVSLSADLDPPSEAEGPKLYGLERLEMERMLKERRQEGPVSVYELGRRHAARRHARRTADPAKASRSVVRLVLVGLVIFALGEPALAAGHDAAAGRALVAMMVFLLAAALLMSAANCWTYLWRVRSQSGQVEPIMVARRLGSSFILMVLMLVGALATPGLLLHGRGEIAAPAPVGSSVAHGSGDRQATGEPSGQETVQDPSAEGRGGREEGGSSAGDGQGRRRSETARGDGVSFLATLSAWVGQVRGPLRLLILLIVGVALWRAAPGLLQGLRRGARLDRLAELWRRFLDAFGLRFRRSSRGSGSTAEDLGDPFVGLGELAGLEPRLGILESFVRLRLAWRIVGHVPDPQLTPTEMVASLPRSLGRLKEPSRRLAEIYCRAAYGDAPVTEQDLRDGLAALRQAQAEHQALAVSAGAEPSFDKVSR